MIVQVNCTVNSYKLENRLNEIYNPVSVEWKVNTDDVKYDAALLTGFIDKNSRALEAYNDKMQALIDAYKAGHTIESNTSYIFVLPENYASKDSGKDGVEGFMPRGKRYGFVFLDQKNTDALSHSVAHELGHGRWRLQHVFDGTYGFKDSDKGATDNLMDYYSNGTDLAKWQWEQLNDPAWFSNPFEGDEKGMINLKPDEYVGFSPNGRVITERPAGCLSVDIDRDSYFIAGFTTTNGIYKWSEEKAEYTLDGHDSWMVASNDAVTGKVAIWKLSPQPQCYVLYHFIEVTDYKTEDFTAIKEKITNLGSVKWEEEWLENAVCNSLSRKIVIDRRTKEYDSLGYVELDTFLDKLGIKEDAGEYRIYILDADDNQGFEEAKADKAENVLIYKCDEKGMFLAHINDIDGLVAKCYSDYSKQSFERLHNLPIYRNSGPVERIFLDILARNHVAVFGSLLCATGEEAARTENGWSQFRLGVFHELIQMVNVVDMVFGSMEAAEQLPQESINYLTDPKNILLDTAGGQNADLKACLESIDENLSVKDRISRQIDCYLEKLPPAIGIQKEVAFELADFFFDCDSVNFRDGSYNLCWHRGGRVVGFILPFFVSGGQNATSRVKNIAGVAVDASEAQKALKVLDEAYQGHHVIEKPIRGKRIIRNSDNTITMTREEHGKVSVVTSKSQTINKQWIRIDEREGLFNGKIATYYDVAVAYQSQRIDIGMALIDNDILEFHLNIPQQLQQQGLASEIIKKGIQDYMPSKIKGWWLKKNIYETGESTNLTIFKQKLREGLSPENAVFETPTGKIMKENGFGGKPNIIKNTEEEVIIHFNPK